VDETTVVRSLGAADSIPPPTEVYKPRDWQAPDYQPPGFQSPPAPPARKKAWPWVVGTLVAVLFGVLAIGIGGLLLYKLLNPTPQRNSSIPIAERPDDPKPNLNSNAPVSNSNAPVRNSNNQNSETPIDDNDATSPPADKDVVLAALRDLEHEWTVANINADKQKLRRILADDYASKGGDGKVQGKADYIRTITPNTTIQKWDFEDLKVTLMETGPLLMA
jgi:hypothetical protein